MVKVNPPPHTPLPEQLKQDPRMRAWAQAVDRILFQLYNRSGGGADNISQLVIDLDAAEAAIVVNSTNIATNTSSISTNAGNIATNTTNITANTAEIEFNRRYTFMLS